MNNILDNLSTLKQNHLSFLQRAIETVNSTLLVRRLSIVELQKIISEVPLEALNIDTDEDKDMRERLLNFLGEGDEAVHYLITKLDDYHSRYFASSFLGWFGTRATIAIPKLIDLASGHSSAAGAAQNAIVIIGEANEKILQAVKNSLVVDDDESFRNLSSLAVRTELRNSYVFFEVLSSGATHANPNIKEAVADIIWKLQISDKNRIKSILESLSASEDENVKDAALASLDLL